MKGIFFRRNFNVTLLILFLVGLFFIGGYVSSAILNNEQAIGSISYLIIGLFICAVVVPSWLMNYKAFITIDEASITAKYHWFGKINCKTSDVDFVVAGTNSLTISLKNGKTHIIMGIKNSFDICSYIRRYMSFEVVDQPEKLIQKLKKLRSAKRKNFIFVFVGIALMFINIFVAVFLTGGRDMHEFSKNDWIIFSIMVVVEITTVIATFYFANKAGKKDFLLAKLKYTVRRKIIETKPLLSGNAVKVFADEDYNRRITLFGFPNDASGYYTIQAFTDNYIFVKIFESEVFENMEQLSEVLEEFVDLTEYIDVTETVLN